MVRNLLIAMYLLLFASISIADEFAFTASGKKVLLKDDGTWHYVEEPPEGKEKFDFRKTKWGMSIEHVMYSEGVKARLEVKDALVYEAEVLGMNCLIFYEFIGNILASGNYFFVEEYSNRNDYISDYDSVKNTLREKYGSPKSTEINWRDDSYKDKPPKYGLAVGLGHLIYRSTWETDSTDIILSLAGGNYEIELVVHYRSKVFYPKLMEKQEKEKESKSDF